MKPPQKKTVPVRILLMEDQGKVAQLVRLHLQSRGFTVDIAENGTRGLEMNDADKYDVLLVDHRMPGMTGLDVIRELKRRGPMPPVIMVSGLGIDSIAVEALKLGALDYVIKDPEAQFLHTLPVTITQAIDRHRKTAAVHEAGQERDTWLRELQQRLRELGCLYGIERLLSGEAESMDVALSSAVGVIPGACRYPDTCWARLVLDEQEFTSPGYADTEWKKLFDLSDRAGRSICRLEVGYSRPPADSGGELFSSEETDLLQSVADRIGQFIDQWRTKRELKVTNEELSKLHRAVEQSASAVMITNAAGEIEYVNPKFIEMSGYTKCEVLGRNPRILKSGEKGPEEYAEMWRILLSGKQWRGEFHNKKKDGALYWDYSTVSPITTPDGTVTHFVAVKEDITDAKEAENLRAAMLQLSARIAGCETADELCRVVVEGIRELMEVDRCGLFLGHPDEATFRGTYGTDINGNTTDEHDHFWNIRKERDVIDLFASTPYQTGFPLGAPEARAGEEDLCSTLIALKQSGRVFGVISIDNRLSRRPVTENQMAHIALLAEILGNALQMAQTRETLKKSADRTRQVNDELEAFNRAMIGRENRIIELKEEVNRLLAETGKPARYPPVWASGSTASREKKR